MAVSLWSAPLKSASTDETSAGHPSGFLTAWSMMSGVSFDSKKLKVFESVI
jgi:hypothetical protein